MKIMLHLNVSLLSKINKKITMDDVEILLLPVVRWFLGYNYDDFPNEKVFLVRHILPKEQSYRQKPISSPKISCFQYQETTVG